MKLSQRQLRTLVEQVVSEAKKIDPFDAAKQVQDAIKVLMKFGPMLSNEIDTLISAAREADVKESGGPIETLEEISFALENIPREIESAKDLVTLLKALKRATKTGAAAPPAPPQRPGSQQRWWKDGSDSGSRPYKGGAGVHRTSARVGGKKS